jgi:hypothetical protein
VKGRVKFEVWHPKFGRGQAWSKPELLPRHVEVYVGVLGYRVRVGGRNGAVYQPDAERNAA